MTTRTPRRQRGITLVESLVGFLVLTLGLVGALRLQSWLRLNGDIAQQRTEAVRLGQHDMEQLRTFTTAAAFNGMADASSETGALNTAFTLTRTLSPNSSLKHSHVQVTWLDRSGAPQAVDLRSSVVGLAPVYSASLALPPQDTTLAVRRHLPAAAVRLGPGRSVIKPASRSTVAWVVNNATGEVTAQCSVPATLAVRAITEANLAGCGNVAGALVRGFIGFSLGATPDALQPDDAPLALGFHSLAAATRCETEPGQTGTQRHLAYTCFVPGRGDVGNSDSNNDALQIVPEGWVIGDTAATFKVCRYASAGTVQRLQNYLVIRGDITCPGSLPPHNVGSVATVQHQP